MGGVWEVTDEWQGVQFNGTGRLWPAGTEHAGEQGAKYTACEASAGLAEWCNHRHHQLPTTSGTPSLPAYT